MKDYKELVSLANRLAESVLMDWDKEEQVRLAKNVACECHKFFNEGDNFFSLVKRMREAQEKMYKLGEDEALWTDRAIEIESEVDEYLKKMKE